MLNLDTNLCYDVEGDIYKSDKTDIVLIFRASEDLVQFNPECVPVTSDSLESAIDWLWSLDRTAPVSKTSTVEAVVKALDDHSVSN